MIPWYLVLKDNSITHIQAIYHESFIEEKFCGFLGIHETFSTNIALFKHGFKRMREEDDVVLPDPRGELSKLVASSVIE